MIVCKQCGNQNESGATFCGSCGAYLAWKGEAIEEPQPVEEVTPEPEPTPPPAPAARKGIVDRIKDVVGVESAPAESSAPPVEDDEPAVPTKEPAPKPAVAPQQAEPSRRPPQEAKKPAARKPTPKAAPAASEPASQEVATPTEGTSPKVKSPAAAGGSKPETPASEPRLPVPGPSVEPKVETKPETKPAASKKDTVVIRTTPEPVRPAAGSKPAAPASAASTKADDPDVALGPTRPDRSAVPPSAAAASEPVALPPQEPAEPALPGPVRPGREAVRPGPRESKPSREIQPGDLVCGSCGEGNAPSRKFCRRCGESLEEAVVATETPVPWWRRIFARKRKRKDPRRSRRKINLRRILAAFGLAGIASLLVPGVRTNVVDLFSTARERVLPRYAPVNPTGAKATSAIKAHPATAAIDGVRNTYWAENGKGNGESQVLTITFGSPVNLAKMIVTSGASAKAEEFRAQPRPKELHLVFSDGSTKDIVLLDDFEPQDFDLDARAVRSIEIHIVSVYRSIKGSAASIAEIEFRSRS